MEVKSKRTMDRYVEKASTRLEFKIDAPIVENIIGGLFFTPVDDEEGDGQPITKTNALKLLVNSWTGRIYLVEIKNPYRFNLPLDHTIGWAIFSPDGRCHKTESRRVKESKTPGFERPIWSANLYIRILVAANLQKTKSI